jgi:ribosome maturation factor RimP
LFLRVVTQLLDLQQRIRAIAERVARSYSLDIFDVQFRRESSGWVLRIFVDLPPPPGFGEPGRSPEGEARPAGEGVPEAGPAAPKPLAEAGVRIEDCERVSRDVGTILDVEETIDRPYTLEVSSPGLDRPLRAASDYRRFAGRLAKIVVSHTVDGQTHFSGRLQGLDQAQQAVVIETAPGKRHLIPLDLIARARLEVEF